MFPALMMLALTPAEIAAIREQPVVLPSADDCAIFAVVGKAQVGWTDKPPARALFGRLPLKSDGSGTYLVECRWADYGLGEPEEGTPRSPAGFYFSRPVYGRGGKTATLKVTIGAFPQPDAEGRAPPPFMQESECSLTKERTGWKLVACKVTAIT